MTCLFCAAPPADPLYSDARCFVVLHEDRAVPGHAMVVWRAHVENVSNLAAGDARHLMDVYRIAEGAILDVTGAERAVILKLGIQTPHLHLHIYPVSAALDRTAVQAILDAKVRTEVEDGLAGQLRQEIATRLRR